MSRIGKSPIALPAGVELKVDKNIVSVKGPKGVLYQVIASDGITVVVEDNNVLVTRNTEQKTSQIYAWFVSSINQ